MKYKVLGNTGLKVSELCLGTMTFGGKGFFSVMGNLGQDSVDQLMKKSVDAGVNFIDTANVYSEGVSEELTGKAIRNLGLKRDELIIATKVRGAMGPGPNDSGLSRKHIIQQVEASLKRLNTDYIDLYQIHNYDPLTPISETIDTLDDLVRSGKVRYTGASNMPAWQLMKAVDYAKYERKTSFISMQSYYSLAGRDLEREMVPLLLDQKIGLMIWSPLAAGLLSGKYNRNGESREGGRLTSFESFPVDRQRAFNILDILRPMAEEKNASLAQLALAWLLYQPAVTSVIVGANKIEQLEDNLKSSDIVFSEEELKKLDEVSQLPLEYPGWLEPMQQDRR